MVLVNKRISVFWTTCRQRANYTTLPREIPASPRSPAPPITQEDIDTYFESLRTSGWCLQQTTRRLERLGYEATWWRLHRSAVFPSFKLAMEYVNGVADTAKLEKHHPTILIHNRVNVDVSLDTHDTIERPAVLSGAQTITSRWPGLTLRDFRMALLIDPLAHLYKGYSILPSAESKHVLPSLDQLLSIQIKSM